MAGIGAKIKHAWNAFLDEDSDYRFMASGGGSSYGVRPDRIVLRYNTERSVVSSIYNRLATDVSMIDIRHVRRDKDGRYIEEIKSDLNECLTVEANLDQSARALRQDIAMTLFDEGVAVVVPVDTTLNPEVSGGYDIKSMRVGSVVEWRPRHVKVRLYNDAQDKGLREEIWVSKKYAAVIENPFYTIMNEPNSTLQRLLRKLNQADKVDDDMYSGRLDVIIQLPYVIKSDARRKAAEQRAKDIEFQLKGSRYGIAYTDGTEKITQLNRPVENGLPKQVEALKAELYDELGLTADIRNGTASEAAMLNYQNRTIKPIVDAIVDGMHRKFLTRTARSQGQSIQSFLDPFRLVPMEQIAEIADKFTRNEILSSNEIRSIVGFKPSTDPKADELRNSNMPEPNQDNN